MSHMYLNIGFYFEEYLAQIYHKCQVFFKSLVYYLHTIHRLMFMNTIAQNMVEIMKYYNRTYIWYGDIELIEECAKKSHILPKHPQKMIQHILNALDDTRYFSKGYIYSDINGKNRKYRCFKLKI